MANANGSVALSKQLAVNCLMTFISRRELVEGGVTGLLFEAGNSFALKQKVCQLIENFNKAYKMGEIAKERYLRMYNSQVNYRRLKSIYASILKYLIIGMILWNNLHNNSNLVTCPSKNCHGHK